MRRWMAVVAIVVAGASGAFVPAWATSRDKAPKSDEPLVITETLGGLRTEALKDLVARFNATGRGRIEVQERRWNDGRQPAMAILDGDDEADFLAGRQRRYLPLYDVMRQAREPLKTLRPPPMMTRTPLDARGRLLALPVGLSTPVLFFNRDAFKGQGLDPDAPPATWAALQTALGRLVDAGFACPFTVSDPARVMIENGSAWHNEPTEARRGRSEQLSINGLLQIKHVAMMASWYRARYLRIFPQQQDAERSFADGQCAVIAAPSSAYPMFRKDARFSVGVGALPYYSDYPGAPQNTLADGSALWVSNGLSRNDYKTIARFISFWLEPANQIAWQKGSGYLPLNAAGLFAVQDSTVLGKDLDAARVAVAQLINKPVTPVSQASLLMERPAVRRIVDEELDGVWADRIPAKEALDNAVKRADALK